MAEDLNADRVTTHTQDFKAPDTTENIFQSLLLIQSNGNFGPQSEGGVAMVGPPAHSTECQNNPTSNPRPHSRNRCIPSGLGCVMHYLCFLSVRIICVICLMLRIASCLRISRVHTSTITRFPLFYIVNLMDESALLVV